MQWALAGAIAVCLLSVLVFARSSFAINALPTPDPIPGSYGLAATKTQPPPTQAPTITTPGNGASFSNSPITVSGICPNDLLVQVYNNGVMVGSVMCTSGSFSVQVSLFAGVNELTAVGFDSLEQAGPTSNTVSVTYTDTSFTAFGQLITLTSQFGRRSAPVNNELTWPLQLTGGNGPYAFSIDWGDGGESQLLSSPVAGAITIAHTYKNAGIYQVNIRVTDVNGVSAFLQVIAVASGKPTEAAVGASSDVTPTTTTSVLWGPAAASVALLIPAYWLGRRSQLVALHNKMLKERDMFQAK
jgi:hypothetical protein